MITVKWSVAMQPKTVDGTVRSRKLIGLAGLSSDSKPTTEYENDLIGNGSEFDELDTGKTYKYDEENSMWRVKSGGATSQAALTEGVGAMAEALEGIAYIENRITSLTETDLAAGMVVETVGTPIYVEDVSVYSSFGISATGWYVIARISPKDGSSVAAGATVTGADGYIATEGADHIDVAVRFDVAAVSKAVAIDWGTYAETIVFKATDLAVRNLDYRSTYYIYDVSPFTAWTYVLTTDTTFVSGTHYYTKNGDVYTEAEVTAGETLPAIYYEQNVSYALTADETFVEGTEYYTENEGEYSLATVTAGEAVTENTYYVQSVTYSRTTDDTFTEGKTYYTTDGTTYTEANVTSGEPVPAYYVHSRLTISGMTRNVTYRLDTTVDCPMEIVLPAIDDGDDYGAWFDFMFKHKGTYSVTLTPTEGVKIATNNTPNPTKGMNLIHLHYNYIDGAKVWSALNTHTDFTE